MTAFNPANACIVTVQPLPIRDYKKMAIDIRRRKDILGTHRAAIREAALRNNARSIALVGSVARGEDTSASDYDFLVDFLPGTSLFDIAGLRIELEDLLDSTVDVISLAGLKDHCRGMLDDAIPL